MMEIHDLNTRSEIGRGNFITPSFEHHFTRAQCEVRSMLPDPNCLTIEDCRATLQRYTAAVNSNFVIWLVAASLCARSQDARYAASENAFVEIRDDHPGMLRSLARSCEALPGADDYEMAEHFTRPVQKHVNEMNGMFLIALCGCIEHVSLEYLPWLAHISCRLGATDTEYIDVHGEADIGHAKQFVWALNKEAALHQGPEEKIAEACATAIAFLKAALLGSGSNSTV